MPPTGRAPREPPLPIARADAAEVFQRLTADTPAHTRGRALRPSAAALIAASAGPCFRPVVECGGPRPIEDFDLSLGGAAVSDPTIAPRDLLRACARRVALKAPRGLHPGWWRFRGTAVTPGHLSNAFAASPAPSPISAFCCSNAEAFLPTTTLAACSITSGCRLAPTRPSRKSETPRGRGPGLPARRAAPRYRGGCSRQTCPSSVMAAGPPLGLGASCA